MKKYTLIWKAGEIEEISGNDFNEAFENAGYTKSALKSLDRHEEIKSEFPYVILGYSKVYGRGILGKYNDSYQAYQDTKKLRKIGAYAFVMSVSNPNFQNELNNLLKGRY